MSISVEEKIKFAIIYPLGLEDLGLDEIRLKFGEIEQPTTYPGVLEYHASPLLMLEMSLFLKIPTRILMRLDEYKVRDFPKLYNKITKYNWNRVICSEDVHIKVTNSKSRLIHSGRIEESIRKGLKKNFSDTPSKKKDFEKSKSFPIPTLHFNLKNDLMTVSIDISGTELFKRSRIYSSEAPLRENLAAALVFMSEAHKKKTILDPMAGSGTLLIEALGFNTLHTKKEQAWEAFPCFKAIIKSSISKELRLDSKINEVSAFEIDKKTYKALESNFNDKNYNEIKINLKLANSFEQNFGSSTELVLSNPPWGERVKIVGKKSDYFEKIINKYLTKHDLALILPRENHLPNEILKNAKIINIKSGGFPISLVYWKKQKS
ncbi:MAG: N-6 DNA methylase [Bacteriovoracaceae bacterium]|nr:N-6 DNA methylase [Bacteriovoracaceae bacterium]